MITCRDDGVLWASSLCGRAIWAGSLVSRGCRSGFLGGSSYRAGTPCKERGLVVLIYSSCGCDAASGYGAVSLVRWRELLGGGRDCVAGLWPERAMKSGMSCVGVIK